MNIYKRKNVTSHFARVTTELMADTERVGNVSTCGCHTGHLHAVATTEILRGVAMTPHTENRSNRGQVNGDMSPCSM